MTFNTEKALIEATNEISEAAANIEGVVEDINVKFAAETAKVDTLIDSSADIFMNKKPVEITTENLNDFKTSGIFEQPQYESVTKELNYPFSKAWNKHFSGLLEVVNRGGIVYQRFTVYKGETFTRLYNGGEWSEWLQIALESKTAGGFQDTIDLLALDQDIFYPVIITGNGNEINHINITKHYGAGIGAGNSLMGLFLDYSFIGNSWGGNPISTKIKQHFYTYKMAALLGYVGYYRSCVFLRGGYEYHIKSSDKGTQLQIITEETQYHTSSITSQNRTIAPISAATALAHPAALDAQLDDTYWNHDIAELGKS